MAGLSCCLSSRSMSTVRIGVDPQALLPPRGGGRVACIGAGLARLFPKPPRQSGWPAFGRSSSRPMIAVAICRRLRQFAEHHQLRAAAACRADLPGGSGRPPIALHQFRAQEERQAFVAGRRAHGCRYIRRRDAPISTDPATNSEEACRGNAQAETALADIGDRVAAMRHSANGRSPGPALAAELGYRDRDLTLQKRGRGRRPPI